MLPSVSKNSLIILQKKKTCQWFKKEDIEVLDWPAHSPDLNSIEDLWNWLGMEVAKHKPSTVAVLKQLLIELCLTIARKNV